MNYFEFFGLKPSFAISPSLLKSKYYKISKTKHPDRFVHLDDDSRSKAEKEYSEINQAYEVMQDENRRLQYLLQILGIISSDENFTLDQMFLMSMLDLNDLIDTAPQEAMAELHTLKQDLLEDVQDILEKEDLSDISNIEQEKLKNYFYKKQYINRLEDQIKM